MLLFDLLIAIDVWTPVKKHNDLSSYKSWTDSAELIGIIMKQSCFRLPLMALLLAGLSSQAMAADLVWGSGNWGEAIWGSPLSVPVRRRPGN